MFNRLHLYTAHRKTGVTTPEAVEFVREGFSWSAFILGMIWLLYKRLWLAAIGLFLVQALLMGLEKEGVLHPASIIIMQLGVQIIVGFYANDWLRSKMRKQGYITADIVTGDSKLRAEQRYFERVLHSSI